MSCRYTSTAEQSIPNVTDTVLDFATKDFDTHNAVTTGVSWVFTAPVTGKYLVMASAGFAETTNFDANEYMQLKIFKGSTAMATEILELPYSPSSAWYGQVTCSTILSLSATDTVHSKMYHSGGGSQSLGPSAASNWIAIHQLS